MRTIDMNVGDKFTVELDNGSTKTFQVVEKGTTDDEVEYVRSVEVTT